MSNSLEDRLKAHARSFDGLLSLIPAKTYYGEDVSDQWKRKKQTKEEAKAAKRAKLDPSAAKSAKDILDEAARKRKREDSEDAVRSDIEVEAPGEGLKKPAKKQKVKKAAEPVDAEAKKRADERKAERVARKDQRKEERLKKQQDRKREKGEKAKQGALKNKLAKQSIGEEDAAPSKPKKSDEPHTIDAPDADELADIDMEDDEGELAGIDIQSESSVLTPAVDMSAIASASSSISSIAPPDEEPEKKESQPDPEELKARLDAKITAMRAARKADGSEGKQPRSRQELLEQRRKKEEERKAHKKEMKRKEKEQERLRIIEEAAASITNSPLATPVAENNFTFGTIAFEDGQKVDPSLTKLAERKKKPGPKDFLGALQSAKNKQARLNGLDEEKRADIEQKDLWLHAKMKASGEKVKSDVSLLKKSLKRQQKMKVKSGNEWRERKEGVEKSIAAKQKKREDNLQKRRDEKGMKGKGKKKKTGKKPKSRPGFEGSFSTKARKKA